MLFKIERLNVKRIKQLILGVVVATIATCSLAIGQIRNLDLQEPLGGQVLPKILPGPQVPALERVIDRDNYTLGPGDYLEIIVWGNIEVRSMVKIGPDGFISIPTVGVVDLRDKTITEADLVIQTNVGKRYPRSSVSVRLIGIRKMVASVSGRVRVPGMYVVNAVDRLSTILLLAGGILEPKAVKPEVVDIDEAAEPVVSETGTEIAEEERPEEVIAIRPSLRRIVITSRNNVTNEIDYLRYQKFGDLRYNPVLRDGDRIHIPIRNTKFGIIDIYGAVNVIGEYEFVEGDRLFDLVEFAGGFTADAKVDAIVIDRSTDKDNSPERILVNLSSPDASERGPLLRSGDQIFVRHRFNFRPKFHVMVLGEVKYPGRYPIEDGISTLTELIEDCGGFTEKANLGSSKLFRATSTGKINLEFERLSKLTVPQMSDVEYAYFKAESRQSDEEVLVNFKELFSVGGENLDVILRDSDRIYIPVLNPTVRVTGQVNNPGLVAYTSGMMLEDFIREAGGYTLRARENKIRLIKADTGLWLQPRNDDRIDIGDTIFIPEKKDFDGWMFAKDLLTVATQLATVFVVVQTLK